MTHHIHGPFEVVGLILETHLAPDLAKYIRLTGITIVGLQLGSHLPVPGPGLNHCHVS